MKLGTLNPKQVGTIEVGNFESKKIGKVEVGKFESNQVGKSLNLGSLNPKELEDLWT